MWTQRIMTSLPTDNGVLWPGAHRSGKLSFNASFTHSFLTLFGEFFFPVFFSAVCFFSGFSLQYRSLWKNTQETAIPRACCIEKKQKKTPWIQKTSHRWEKHHKKVHCSAFDNSLTYSKHLAMGFCATFLVAFSLKTTLCITTIMANLKQGNWSILEKKTKNDFALNECICSKFETNYHDDAITILNKCD